MYINGMLLFKYKMIIFENVKMTYDGINILRNEILNDQLSFTFEGICAHICSIDHKKIL